MAGQLGGMRSFSGKTLPTKAAVAILVLIASACSPPDGGPSSNDEILPGSMAWFGGPLMAVEAPAIENLEKVMIGKSLFNDKRLSADSSHSCASCHDLSAGGDDGRQVAVGIYGRVGSFNTPTVFNASMNFAQFWDGRAQALQDQISQTVENPVEMDGDWSEIVVALRGDKSMSARINEVYDRPISKEIIVDALAAYLGVLLTPDAPLDLFLKGDSMALTAEQHAGYDLFLELGCVSCHQGRNVGGNFFQRFGVMDDLFTNGEDVNPSDLGRYNVTGRERDRHMFKVPGLRNVAETAPYFHDGSAQTLEEAIEIMIQFQLGRVADDEEVRLLAEFLGSLSGKLDEKWL
jgi:cytochrome c peroxidase